MLLRGEKSAAFVQHDSRSFNTIRVVTGGLQGRLTDKISATLRGSVSEVCRAAAGGDGEISSSHPNTISRNPTYAQSSIPDLVVLYGIDQG